MRNPRNEENKIAKHEKEVFDHACSCHEITLSYERRGEGYLSQVLCIE